MESSSHTSAHARMLRILKAKPDQLEMIDRVLAGEKPFPRHHAMDGPLLLNMGAAAKYLGVNRGTLWRMVRTGRLKPIEILPGCYRMCRRDIEKFVAKRGCIPVAPVETTNNGD